MNYPVVIHKDARSDYGVTVPDLPGCFSVGRTMDEALDMAREAIELHLEGLIEDGQVVPRPRAIDHHRTNSQYKGGVWALVSIDPSHLRQKAQRINITMPERILYAVDRAAAQEGETRSGLLAKAAVSYVARKPVAKPGRRGASAKFRP